MEIYKLSDEVPGERKKSGGADFRRQKKGGAVDEGGDGFGDCGDGHGGGRGGGHAELKVTDMKAGVKNPERVNIYVNGKYAFSLDVVQVVNYKLKVGKVLDARELAELKKAAEFGKAYKRALEWAMIRPRSVRELRDYLRRRSVRDEARERQREWEREREVADLIAKGEEVDAEKMSRRNAKMKANLEKREKYDFDDLIVERLCEKGYVDDRRFAEYYVRNRFVKKGVSRRRLEMELMKKGIERAIIEEVLGARNDKEEIQKIIAKKRTRYDDEKLIAYLCRQGFDYSLVRELVLG